MPRQNSAEFEEKYQSFPEDVLERCCNHLSFLSEVVLQFSNSGKGFTFSEGATDGLYYILSTTRKAMADSLAEINRQESTKP